MRGIFIDQEIGAYVGLGGLGINTRMPSRWHSRNGWAACIATAIACVAGCSQDNESTKANPSASTMPGERVIRPVILQEISPSANTSAPQATPTLTVPPVNQFVILASRSASFNDRTTVSGGHIGVAASGGSTNKLTAGFDTIIGVGKVLLAPTVTLNDRAQTGEIGANTIHAPASAVTGPRGPYVAPPAQPVPGTITAGTTPVTVNQGQTVNLAAGA
jgi:hypothetical protein